MVSTHAVFELMTGGIFFQGTSEFFQRHSVALCFAPLFNVWVNFIIFFVSSPPTHLVWAYCTLPLHSCIAQPPLPSAPPSSGGDSASIVKHTLGQCVTKFSAWLFFSREFWGAVLPEGSTQQCKRAVVSVPYVLQGSVLLVCMFFLGTFSDCMCTHLCTCLCIIYAFNHICPDHLIF